MLFSHKDKKDKLPFFSVGNAVSWAAGAGVGFIAEELFTGSSVWKNVLARMPSKEWRAIANVAIPQITVGVGSGAIVQSIVARMFTRSGRQTQIEGLHHGRMAAQSRGKMTDFGSGWRGLVSLPASVANEMIGEQNVGFTVSNINEFRDYVGKMSASESVMKELRDAVSWSQKTGKSPILINSDLLKSHGSYQAIARVVRHERIHQAHFADPSNPFFQKELKKAGSLKDAIFKSQMDMATTAQKAGKLATSISKSAIKAQSQQNADSMAWSYTMSYMDKPKRLELLDSERLAFANQMDRTFISRATQATKRIMDTGEGSAIATAGTSTIKSILKAGSRVIKNML